MKKPVKHLKNVLSGGFLINRKVRRYYPFFLFVALLALLWIANTYSARSIQHQIYTTENELKLANTKLKQHQGDYIKNSTSSKLVDKLAKDSIKMAHNATHKIIVKKEKGGNDE
jgi:cell division protein FtsL